MACVALFSLMATIELEFLRPNPKVSLNDEKTIESLFDHLCSLQTFLEKEYKNRGAPNRDLEIKIRDFALKAEDGIEMQLINILPALRELRRTLREVAKGAQELLNIIDNKSIQPDEDTHHRRPPIRLLKPEKVSYSTTPNIEDGFNEDDFRAVYKMLFHTLECERVVSIIGIPGIGKTTLAKRVYASPIVRRYCNQAWVTVPQEYNLQHILLDLLQSMRPPVKNINKGSTLSQLKQQLYKRLGGFQKSYFIVLDNIPNTQAWVDIKACLPRDPHLCRVLLTAQFYNVGRDAATDGKVHEMCVLDPDTSWDLFCKKLPKQLRSPKFEEIGKRIVEECQGLPRSIVAVADRLSKCNYTLQEWKKIEKEVETLGPLYSDADHLSKLTLIYNQLPLYLKVCFLQFAIYPRGSELNVKRLIRIWIAEGFVWSLEHQGLEKEAYLYLHELVRVGLVSISIPEHKMTNVCWIHSSLWDFCTREAKKEGLLCSVNTQQYSGLSLDMFANSCRWLSLYPHRFDYYTLFSSNNPRSLFFFQGDSETLVSFKLLRIVDLSALQIPKSVSLHLLGDLVLLRYLSVPQWFDGLEYVVSNNQNLQTLTVSGAEQQLRTPGHLPASIIWELRHLMHLELGSFYTVDPPSMVKEYLQTLSWVSPTHFTKEVYCNFPNIKYLKVFYKDAVEPSSNDIIRLDYIGDLPMLETLSIIVPVGSVTHLEHPEFPKLLKKLRLSGTNLPAKVLKGIEQLSMLKVLKLENAFRGRIWKPTSSFNSLKFLLIEAGNLEKWEAYGYHFSKLKHLVLRRCYRLEGIPSYFESIGPLQRIELEECPASVIASAICIQKRRKEMYAKFCGSNQDHLSALDELTTVVINGKIHC